MTFTRTVFAFALAVSAGSAFAASPIGTLQSEGRFQVVAADSDKAVTISQSEYTFFSGDTVIASSGDAVLNLNGGGGLGFPKGSRATVIQADNGGFETEVVEGALLYAFPEGRENFVFRVGNFTVHGQAPEVRSMQVGRQGESVGTIERLSDGNIKATVRSGALHIRNGDSVRYQVSAGESVGLLDMPNRTIRTQSEITTPRQPLVLIQSPERVGTNEDFLIRWEAAEPVDGDYVVIAESGAEPDEFESLVNSDEGNELAFEAPGDPGDYEIRFIDGETGEIKRFVYLDVVQDVVGAYWWDKRFVGAAITVAAGASAVYIGRKIFDDDDPEPVSP